MTTREEQKQKDIRYAKYILECSEDSYKGSPPLAIEYIEALQGLLEIIEDKEKPSIISQD